MNHKIVILLATYNGEKYIKEQLDSILLQTYSNIEVIARDDMSNDKTLEILKSYNINIVKSIENLGVKKSFSELLNYASRNSNSDYFMFCDQDDIWEKRKIELTLRKMLEMEKKSPSIPILVHTDLNVVDSCLNIIDNSMWTY